MVLLRAANGRLLAALMAAVPATATSIITGIYIITIGLTTGIDITKEAATR
jgi:hypothetical protein